MQSHHDFRFGPRVRDLLAPAVSQRDVVNVNVLGLRLRSDLPVTLRFCLRLSLRGSNRPTGRQCPLQHRLRALRFADIPKPLPIQDIGSVAVAVTGASILSGSLALDALAIASALAPPPFAVIWSRAWGSA